ncbi:hypothetical protein ScPMuIL_009023 [Solemya velum]
MCTLRLKQFFTCGHLHKANSSSVEERHCGIEDSDDKEGSEQTTCTDSPPSSFEEALPFPERPPRKRNLVNRIAQAARNRKEGLTSVSVARTGSDTTSQCSSSAAMRRRDIFPKRRHNSASALNTITVPAKVVDKNGIQCKSYRCVNQRRSLDSTCYRNRQQSSDIAFNKAKSLDNPKRDSSPDSMRSSQSSPYEEFDIVGETFEARFPWQKDVSTQCTISPVEARLSCGECSSPASSEPRTPETKKKSHSSLLRKRRKLRTLRPHSIGCTEDTAHQYDVMERKEERIRKTRKSEPFVHRQTKLPQETDAFNRTGRSRVHV